MLSLINKARRLESLVRPSQPGYVIFFVTNRCNFRCEFCFYYDEIEKGQKPDELSLDEIRRFAPTIGPLMQLSLTGGEPFLRKDFTEVTKILLDHIIPTHEADVLELQRLVVRARLDPDPVRANSLLSCSSPTKLLL